MRGRGVSRGAKASPNGLERRVLATLIDAFQDAGWRFNVDTVVAGKVPDFLRSDGLNVMVDVHGDYWHQGEKVRVRQAIFRRAGIRLVVIWESEFKADPGILLRRVRRATADVRRTPATKESYR